MSLRARLALVVGAAVAALVLAGGAVLLHQLQTGLDTSLDTTLRARADALIQRVGPDGSTDFQDSGKAGLLPPGEALAQVVGPGGVLLESLEGARGRPLLSSQELAVARGRPLIMTKSIAGLGSVRLLAVPVAGSGKQPIVVVVGTARTLPLEAIAKVRAGLIVAGVTGVLLSAVGAWLLAGASLRPVERMRQQATQISAGDMAARLAVPATKDEIARLADTMNALLERLQRALAQQRNLVADAGHELRTPLTILRGELELATRPGRSTAGLLCDVGRALDETDRLIRLAEDLLLLARTDGQDPQLCLRAVVLDEVAQEAIVAVRGKSGARGISVNMVHQGKAVVTGDRDRLRQVMDNLLDNAIRFARTDGVVTVRIFPGPTGWMVMEVLDDGPAFPVEFLPHAFERFRRAEASRSPDGAGAGLGLAIVASLVRLHGGVVSAGNEPDGGACIRVELPVRGRTATTKI